MTAGYDTLIVTFSDPICVLDRMFADADAWGTDTLKGWVEDYGKYEVYANKRAYGSHHFRIQHALRKGMAHTLYDYR